MMHQERHSVKSDEVDIGTRQSFNDEDYVMNTNITKPVFRWEWNINTLAVVFGFVVSFVAWGYTISGFNERQQQTILNVTELKASRSVQDARLSALELIQAKSNQAELRLSIVEKGIEALDSRMGRVTDSYSNQFTDFRSQLNSISIQMALIAQSQARLEGRPPAISGNK